MKVFLEFLLPATMASDSANPPPCPSSVGFFLDNEEGGLRSLEVALELTVLPSCLRVTVLGRPPLLEETPGVITVVGVGGVR